LILQNIQNNSSFLSFSLVLACQKIPIATSHPNLVLSLSENKENVGVQEGQTYRTLLKGQDEPVTLLPNDYHTDYVG
jgi:ABC-type uncharacterized transport system substrate-binding protein